MKVNQIESYFSQYNAKPTEDEKIKFAQKKKEEGTDKVPGRDEWRKWVTKHYSTHWKIHSRISKILSAHGIHPQQIMAETGESAVPNNATYLAIAIDAIGHELFGSEALTSNNRLHPKLRDPTMIMAQRTWTLQARNSDDRRQRVEKMLQLAEEKLLNLESGKVTVKTINQAIRAVANFEKACYGAPEHISALERLKENLEHFIPDDQVSSKSGARSVPKTAKRKKVTKENLARSATPEEVARLLETYDVYFASSSSGAEELEIEESQGLFFGEPVEGADPGVQIEAAMTTAQLATRLGLGSDNMPFLFNNVRHSGGYSAWTKEFEDACRSKSDSLEKFSLQWHQLCGVHAALRMILTPAPQPTHCAGVLFADDVGLGKTIQTSAIMAILSDVCVLQQRNLALPPIARDLPFLKDSDKIPSLPHLVIVPGTLLRQWEHELQCFFKNKSVDILMYESGIADHEEFWKPNGVYHSSNHPESHRIILAAQSALQQDFNLLYTTKRGSMSLPWDLPERAQAYDARIPSTLYGQRYLTVAIDEAQGLRNLGAKHSSALRILDQGSVRLILTATPLQTSTKDIASMGRLLGIPYFFSELAREDQAADNAQLRRAKIEKGGDPDSFTSEDDPVKVSQVEISKRLAAKFQNRVIRRIATSLDVDGNPLISLPPIRVVEGILHLTEREREILEEITLDGLGDASTANGRNVTSQTFYIEHRMGVTFARPDTDDPLPVFKTIKEWEEQLSTKINVLVIVSRYILMRDDMPPVYFENGVPILSSTPSTPHFTRLFKIVIYQEFPSYTALVINIFELYHIKVLSICGRDTFEQRAKTVKRFNEDPECRILIFSKVGSTGLNLTRANFIIFLDQPWSAQDERQITGRVWRQRQRRPVTAIHLLAAETADITLSSLARGKREMLDAFLTTNTSKDLLSVMTGDVLVEGDEEAQEAGIARAVPRKKEKKQKTESTESKSESKRRSKGRKPRKSAPTISDDEGEQQEVESTELKSETKGRSKGRKPRKSAPIISDDEEEQHEAVDLSAGPNAALSDGDLIGPSGDSDAIDPVTTDTDLADLSTDASMHESGSEIYEADLSMRATSIPSRFYARYRLCYATYMRVGSSRSSRSSLVGLLSYESSDDEMDDQPLMSPGTNQGNEDHKEVHAEVKIEDGASSEFTDYDENMVLEPPSGEEEDTSVLRLRAKKRARAKSSPPPPSNSETGAGLKFTPPSPSRNRQQSVIKKARLHANSLFEPPKAYSTPRQPMDVDDDDLTSPLMGPLFPPLSTMGVYDPPSPSRSDPPSPSPSHRPIKTTVPRKTTFLVEKPSHPSRQGGASGGRSGTTGGAVVGRYQTEADFPSAHYVPSAVLTSVRLKASTHIRNQSTQPQHVLQ
ncbi:hypothetical protein EST38_g9910 [Candolleomyces aberdarensis]|uniref:Uncharacterized protein n=1 Tax=Candolleomyces aberdarensis TaxID=2316362 RepID=A0A4Q2D8R6_9AGAR|nr:hypothetical protein EST38_g9910 [Candolleomyces aberdarensis]